MPEPEGPDLPPKKNTKSANILNDIKTPVKFIKEKGLLAAFVAAFILITYIVYYCHYYNTGVKLNELYFISVGIGISVFTGLLFTFFKNIYVRTILLFTSVFYLILEMIYVIMWIFFKTPYAYIKTSLIFGLIAGLIYFIYDNIKRGRKISN